MRPPSAARTTRGRPRRRRRRCCGRGRPGPSAERWSGAKPSCPPDRRGRAVFSRTSPLWTFGLDMRSMTVDVERKCGCKPSTSGRSCRTFAKTPQIKDDPNGHHPNPAHRKIPPDALEQQVSAQLRACPPVARPRSIVASSGTVAPAPRRSRSSTTRAEHEGERDTRARRPRHRAQRVEPHEAADRVRRQPGLSRAKTVAVTSSNPTASARLTAASAPGRSTISAVATSGAEHRRRDDGRDPAASAPRGTRANSPRRRCEQRMSTTWTTQITPVMYAASKSQLRSHTPLRRSVAPDRSCAVVRPRTASPRTKIRPPPMTRCARSRIRARCTRRRTSAQDARPPA